MPNILEYLGHAAFRWTTESGIAVVVDPFDNDEARPWVHWFATPMPIIQGDYALVTHDHFDHRAVHRVPGATIILTASAVSDEELTVRGIADEHVPGHGPPQMQNVMFVIEAAGLRCCHWGDNRHDPPPRVVEQLGRVDILMLPIDDSCHLLKYAEVNAIADMLGPRGIVPMHYFHPGVSDERSPLEGIQHWLESQPLVSREMGGALELHKSDLPVDRQIWVMEPVGAKARAKAT